jgi:uncharacterized protein
MQLNCENKENHTIQSYDQSGVQIQQQHYPRPLLITATQVIALPNIQQLSEIHLDILDPLETSPQILLIGHSFPNTYLTPQQLFTFTRLKIGVECMAFDAACRTFNILLNEARQVAVLLL